MRGLLYKITLGAAIAGIAVAPALAEVGSVVSSFPARISGMMPVGMAYANGFLWMMFYEGVLAKRTYPTGSVLATYNLFSWGAEGLSFDGSYFWTSWEARVGSDYLCKIDSGNMTVVASYDVDPRYPIRTLAWDGARFWTHFHHDQYKVHEMTNAGSVVSTYNIPYVYPHSMVYVPNLPVGPRLVEGDWGNYFTRFLVYVIPGRGVNYIFLPAIPQPYATAGCWDGQYLWTYGNSDPGGNEYCYQVVAWEPFPGVKPASLGKVKALYR